MAWRKRSERYWKRWKRGSTAGFSWRWPWEAGPGAWPGPIAIEEKRDELDIEGWDLRKALKLLREWNPSLYEWFSSPVCYRNTQEADAIRALLPQYFNAQKTLHCYLGLANRVYKSFLQGETVAAKRYLHTVWCVLICRWTLDRGTPPPLSFDVLVQAEMDGAVKPAVKALAKLRRTSLTQDQIPRIASLERYIEEQMSAISQAITERSWDTQPKIPWETLNALFLRSIQAP